MHGDHNDRLKAEVLSCKYIQADESTVPVIDNEKNKTRKGYMWCIRDVLGGAVFFHYDLGSRSTRTAMALLKDFKGAIQSDGYDVYGHFDGLEDKTMLGCWAHARRKFVEAKGENDRAASEGMVYIGDLYHIETLAREAGMNSEQRMALRKEKAYPQIRKFEEWMEATYQNGTLGPLMREAIEYTYKRLPKLAMYVNNGDWLIDNNLVENAIRPLAIGRKNYLFCGNDASAVRASMMYSFIATCKALQGEVPVLAVHCTELAAINGHVVQREHVQVQTELVKLTEHRFHALDVLLAELGQRIVIRSEFTCATSLPHSPYTRVPFFLKSALRRSIRIPAPSAGLLDHKMAAPFLFPPPLGSSEPSSSTVSQKHLSSGPGYLRTHTHPDFPETIEPDLC